METTYKVFKMDEHSWVIAENQRQATDWYCHEYGFSEEELDVHLCHPESIEAGFWIETSESINNYFKTPRTGTFMFWNGLFCEWVWFRDIVKTWSANVPEILCSTEF